MARELESRGIPTVTLAALRRPMQMVRPPRVLFTGHPNAQIVGVPGDPDAQFVTLRRALEVLATATEPGTFIEMRS